MKDKDRDATPTMGGTIDPVSDDDDTWRISFGRTR